MICTTCQRTIHEIGFFNLYWCHYCGTLHNDKNASVPQLAESVGVILADFLRGDALEKTELNVTGSYRSGESPKTKLHIKEDE